MSRITSPATLADGSVTMEKAQILLREGGWMPTGAISQTVLDRAVGSGTLSITSGVLYLVGGIVLPANQSVSSVSFFSGGTSGASMTNQWFCLVDKSLNVLRKTVDDTSNAWAGNTVKTLALSSTYTPSSAIEIYAGIMVAAGGTMPNLRGMTANTNVMGLDPVFAASSTTGLTNPASLGATAGALTAIAAVPYAYVS